MMTYTTTTAVEALREARFGRKQRSHSARILKATARPAGRAGPGGAPAPATTAVPLAAR